MIVKGETRSNSSLSRDVHLSWYRLSTVCLGTHLSWYHQQGVAPVGNREATSPRLAGAGARRSVRRRPPGVGGDTFGSAGRGGTPSLVAARGAPGLLYPPPGIPAVIGITWK